MTNVGAATAFCELCGRPGIERAGDIEPCPRCAVLACPRCRPTPDACWGCIAEDELLWRRPWVGYVRPWASPALTEHPPVAQGPARAVGSASDALPGSGLRRRTRVQAALAIFCAALILAFAAGGGLRGAPSPPSAQISAATIDPVPRAADAPPGIGDDPNASTPAVAAQPGLTLGPTAIPTWEDVRGTWHGQALAAVRNAGERPMLVDAGSSRYSVVDDDGTHLAEGTFDAALPPVLLPGRTGYLVGELTFRRSPGEGIALEAVPASSPWESTPVPLQVGAVRLTIRDAEVIATGIVTNHGSDPVTGGEVGVVLLDRIGRPLAAVLYSAGTGRLDAGERSAFRAVEPAAPGFDLDLSRRLVAVAWGTPAP